MAQKLAEAGYATFAIDRLGYGESKLDNGYNVTHEAYADMASQIVRQLRAQGFSHVVLAGHSAGAGTTELAGLYGGVDAIMALGWHHRPSNQLGQDFFTGDFARAAQDDYEYFLGTPQHRAEMFYPASTDPALVEADTRAAVLTPSAEIFSIGKQPSRLVVREHQGARLPPVRRQRSALRAAVRRDARRRVLQFAVGHRRRGGGRRPHLHADEERSGGRRSHGQWLRSRPEAPSCRG